MSKQNHTPAPWYVLSEGVTDAAIGYRAIIDADGYTVCNPSPMGEANARLIAAAPMLLEALQDAEFLLRKAGQLSGAMQDSFNRSAADARAAIQKATGG
jgi:hypothetical protein